MRTIIATAGDELQELKKSFGITSLPAIFVERLKARAPDKPGAGAITAPVKIVVDAPQTVSANRALIARRANVDEVCGVLMDTMQSVFTATESCLFLGEPRSLKIVHGAGRAWRKLRLEAVVAADKRSVFGVCLSRNTIVLIHDVSTALHIPDWLKATNLFGAFAALPMKGQHKHGMILVGWSQSKKIVQTTEQSDLIKAILAETADSLGK